MTPTSTKQERPVRDALAGKLETMRAGGEAPDLRGARLTNEDLSNLDFSGCDLSGADLSRSDLTGANFTRCRLSETTLSHARLDGCEFAGADLTGAKMDECSARHAGFGGATLDGASIIHADLEGATLSNACLHDTDLRASNLQKARVREADLTRTNFKRADLRLADFAKSDVFQTVLNRTDLRGAHLKGITRFDTASWIIADIRDVDFTGAYTVRRFIMDQNYLFEFRNHSRLSNYAYLVWWITSDCGRSFTRWALWTLLVALGFAMLFSMVEVDYGPHPTILSSIYYSVVTLTTLGYGDAVPASATAQVLAMVEVAIGYLALGGLMSIFATKMARRAD